MNTYIKKSLIILTLSKIWGSTPIEYTLAVTGGYDDNVMRFSQNEINEAVQDIGIMGGASTFDSFITRFSLYGTKSFIY